MSIPYPGPFLFDHGVVSKWQSTAIGVYFCGRLAPDGKFYPLYVGRAIGEGGIRSRLLQHLLEDKWPDVTHFHFNVCTTEREAIDLEAMQIALIQPKYNVQGKRALWP